MLPLFSLTIFLSALLLFTVQPMIARLILPELGGTPAVWNTCMVLFQGLLLAGYGYTMLNSKARTRRLAGWVHGCILALPLLWLPLGLPNSVPVSEVDSPILWLSWVVLSCVGIPFFVLATNNPMLQHWFSNSGHRHGHDPYFLYAASNAGSLIGLFSYPFFIEPLLGLQSQLVVWSCGYVLLLGLIATCGSVAFLAKRKANHADPFSANHHSAAAMESDRSAVRRDGEGGRMQLEGSGDSPRWTNRLHWIALALIPSSLMLGVTSHLTTDVASFPLLWVLPLGLYLTTFILAFSSRLRIKQSWLVRLVPLAVLPMVVTYPFTGVLENQSMLFAMNLLAFFVLSLACHGELADRRPNARYLTEFYFFLSLGGVLGGMFNALLAPQIFLTPIEYSVAIVAGCLIMPAARQMRRDRESRLLDFALPGFLGVVCLSLALGFQNHASQLAVAIAVLVPTIVALTFAWRPLRFGLAVAAIFAGGISAGYVHEEVLFWDRGFFGINRVVADPVTQRHVLIHGTTYHGWQSLEHERSMEPCAYYHREGPLGAAFGLVDSDEARIGVTGLGCGTIMAYHQPGWHFTFFEIDPMVKEIAEDDRLFTYLSTHGEDDYRVVLGDARQKIAEVPHKQFDLLVMDAFSSDMVPAHLLTKEAMQTYDRSLHTNGLIAFHISNRFMDLVPVVHSLAADRGMSAVVIRDRPTTSVSGGMSDHVNSVYVVVSRDDERLKQLLDRPGAEWLPIEQAGRPWTDDYCHILGVLKW